MKPYYDVDGITIYHGDCKMVLPTLGTFDLLLTDPPYGIGENSKKNESRGRPSKKWKGGTHKDYGEFDWDQEPPPTWLVAQMLEKTNHAIVWGGNYYALAPASCWLVWDKENDGRDQADCELAWTNIPGAVRRKKYLWCGFQRKKPEQRVHPTQKPLEVFSWAIQQAPPECKTILDPFMGSGTTLVAARNLGRQAVGIELEEKYCEIAAKRLRQGVLPF